MRYDTCSSNVDDHNLNSMTAMMTTMMAAIALYDYTSTPFYCLLR